MEHHFHIEVAIKYGVEEAVIIYNLAYWIKHNKANKQNLYDGYYWTFNSARAFEELFPYFNSKKISRLLNKLEEAGAIKSGNYNKVVYDRTKWYAICDEELIKFYKLSEQYKSGKSISQNCPMEKTELSNGFDETVQPIPDIKPNIKPNIINTTTKNNKQLRKQQFEEWYNRYGCFKGNRVTAEKHFMKLSDEQVEKVNSYTDYYLTTDTVKNGYIMYPNNFLRTKQYENPIPSNNKDTKPSIDTKIVRRIENIDILLDSSNMIYAKDKDFLEDIVNNDLYSKYRYILDKIKEADIV